MSTPNINEVNANAQWASDNTNNENVIDNNTGIETDKQGQEIKKIKDIKAEVPVKEDRKITKAFCVKCRKEHVMKEPKLDVLKNGKYALKGECENCSKTVFKIIKTEEGKKLKVSENKK